VVLLEVMSGAAFHLDNEIAVFMDSLLYFWRCSLGMAVAAIFLGYFSWNLSDAEHPFFGEVDGHEAFSCWKQDIEVQ